MISTNTLCKELLNVKGLVVTRRKILTREIGKDTSPLFDIAMHAKIVEDNDAQYYPDYAYNFLGINFIDEQLPAQLQISKTSMKPYIFWEKTMKYAMVIPDTEE